MTPTRKRPALGEIGWEVSWSIDTPEDRREDEGPFLHKRRIYPTREAAIQFARQIFPKSAYGAVDLVKVEYQAFDDEEAALGLGEWEQAGEELTFETLEEIQ